MDVNALLNVSSSGPNIISTKDPSASSLTMATEERTTGQMTMPTPPSHGSSPARRMSGSGARSLRRHRTPWDAGGYSLPLTIDTASAKSITIPSPRSRLPTFCSDSPTETRPSISPTSPAHKYSLSHGSISSSYTSSTTSSLNFGSAPCSGSHSRISSLSTVSELQPLTSSFNDWSLFSSDSNSKKMAEEVPREEYHRRLHGTHDTIDLTGDDRRPESPTDVVIRRHGNMSNGLSNLRFTQNNVAGTSGQGRQDALTTLHNFASAGLSNGHDNTPAEDLEEGAANVSPTANSVIQDVANTQVNHPYGLAAPPNFRYVQLNEPLPPIGLHGRSVAEIINAIDWSHPVYAGPNRVVFISRHVIEVAAQFVHDKDELEKEINIFVGTVCKFMDNCNLYSNTARIPWRKALSHFFGRNKKCTRQVPENVWIVMCRKHYQRARYRNTTEYNKRLIRLIAFQVLRIENWSESNRLGGTPQNGIVESWSLQPRRREQMRIDEARKRKLEDDEDVEDDEDEMDDLDVPTPATSGGSSQIPDWLLEMCRDGYSTIDILRIILEIKVRLDSGELTQIPDIEILPKISGDQSQPRSKPRTGRVSKGTSKDLGHRRTQSLENPSAGLYRRHANASRRSSQPNDASRHDAKRQRRDNYQDESYEDDFGTYVGRAAERPDTLRTLPSTSSNLPSLSYGGYGAGANGPLPAPRSNMYNSAATGSFANTRPSHQRTFSDVSNLPWENTVTYNTSATGYDHSTNGMQQEVLHGPSFSSTAYPQWPEIGYAPRTQGASYHQQHQAPTTSYSPQSFFPPLSTSTPGTGASHSRQPSSSYMNGYSSATGGNASSGAHGGFAACYNAGRGSYSGGAQSGFGAAYNLGATSSASGAQGPYGNTYNPVNGQGHNAGYMSSPAGAQQYDGFDRTVDDESKRFDRH